MPMLALIKTCMCVYKRFEKSVFMVEATNKPLGQARQYIIAFHIILRGVI